MDLLASLGLENALPEQSTRLVHPGVISALEKCSADANDGDGGNDSRQVRFNLTYNFGRNEIKKARSRNTGLEDEKNRI